MSGTIDHRHTMRCPVCFDRDIDVIMHLNDQEYSCPKCSFTGQESSVRQHYANLKSRFQWINRRITLEDYEKL